MAFKISLFADFANFLRGTKDVEKALDDVADSLDDLESESGGTDKLERKFSSATKEARKLEKAGKDIGDGVRKGSKEAGKGLDEFKEEAADTAREAAASFGGSFEDVADTIQETLANAFAGFGPAGVAAGIAAATGIGMALAELEKVKQAADDSTERIGEMADELAEVEGDPAALDWAQKFRDVLKEVVDAKEVYETWQTENVTRSTQLNDLADQYNLSLSDQATIIRALAGEESARARAAEILEGVRAKAKGNLLTDNDLQSYEKADLLIDGLNKKITTSSRELEVSTEIWRQQEAAIDPAAEAMKKATEAWNDFGETLDGSVSDALRDFQDDINPKTKKLDFGAWLEDAERAAARALNLADDLPKLASEMKLGPAEQEKLLALGPEVLSTITEGLDGVKGKARTQILKRLKAMLGLDGGEFVVQDGKIVWKPKVETEPEKPKLPTTDEGLASYFGWGGGTTVKIPSEVQDPAAPETPQVTTPVVYPSVIAPPPVAPEPPAGGTVVYPSVIAPPVAPAPPVPSGPIIYSTQVNDTGATTGAQTAADTAQRVADREGNRIQYKTRVNSTGLQAAVNEAARWITPPTIWVNVKARKEVP